MNNTITGQVADLLHRLRSGALQAPDAAILEQIAFDEFVSDVRSVYPVLFQERAVGRKQELGLAQGVQFDVAAGKVLNSLFPAAHLLPVLRRCLLLSAYDNAISEITYIGTLRIRPEWATSSVVLRMGRGCKLDRTPDGWSVKALTRRDVTLAERILADRGWKFDVLIPFAAKP
jgi:hypothetical protein